VAIAHSTSLPNKTRRSHFAPIRSRSGGHIGHLRARTLSGSLGTGREPTMKEPFRHSMAVPSETISVSPVIVRRSLSERRETEFIFSGKFKFFGMRKLFVSTPPSGGLLSPGKSVVVFYFVQAAQWQAASDVRLGLNSLIADFAKPSFGLYGTFRAAN
jgi:hypothetical protein